MNTYTCKSCGANLIINDSKQSFTKCLYCGNSIVVSSENISNLNIKKIIPFSIDKEYAIKRIKSEYHTEIVEAKKVYVPIRFCNFDFDYIYSFSHKISNGSDAEYIYIDHLLDVNVKNEIVFGDSRIKNLISMQELKKQKRIDYDPIKIDDVSIEVASII